MKMSYEKARQVREQLVRDGHLVAMEEIDPCSGKLRYRYFARDFAPKSN